MLTWILWRSLNRSPLRSPFYRWLYPTPGGAQSRAGRLVMLLARLVALFVVLPLVAFAAVSILVTAPFLVLLANTLYGLALAVDTSAGITRERERNTYDLLCTIPPGMLGVHWSYCNGWIYHYWMYGWATLAIALFGAFAALLAPVIPGGVTLRELFLENPGFALSLAVGVIFVLDYFQSVVFGSLIATLTPAFTEDRLNARLLAGSGFLFVQISTYSAAYAFATTLASTLQAFENPLVDPLLPLMSAAAFFIFREGIIVALWRLAAYEFGANVHADDALPQ